MEAPLACPGERHVDRGRVTRATQRKVLHERQAVADADDMEVAETRRPELKR